MKTMQFEVAGAKFRSGVFNLAQINRGDRLTLKLEPGNKYDPKAIAIFKGEHHIGYVPRTHNKQLWEDVSQRPTEVGCCVDASWKSGCWVVVNIKDDSNEPQKES